MFHSPELVFMNNDDLHLLLLVVQVYLRGPFPLLDKFIITTGLYQHSNNSLQMFQGFHGCCSGSRWGSGRYTVYVGEEKEEKKEEDSTDVKQTGATCGLWWNKGYKTYCCHKNSMNLGFWSKCFMTVRFGAFWCHLTAWPVGKTAIHRLKEARLHTNTH